MLIQKAGAFELKRSAMEVLTQLLNQFLQNAVHIPRVPVFVFTPAGRGSWLHKTSHVWRTSVCTMKSFCILQAAWAVPGQTPPIRVKSQFPRPSLLVEYSKRCWNSVCNSNDGSADGFVFVSDIGHKLAGGAGVAEFNAPSRSNICNELSVAVAVGGLPGTQQENCDHNRKYTRRHFLVQGCK